MNPDLLRPLPESKRVKKKALVVKFMVGSKGVSLRLSPVILLILLIGGFYAAQTIGVHTQAEEAAHDARVAELEAQNRRLQTFITHKEREKNQMVALAEARSEELWNELEDRDAQLRELWKVVGKKPVAASASRSRRKSMKGARGGRRDSLAVKLRYRDLLSEMKERRGEMSELTAAAEGYREEVKRKRELALLNAMPSLWPCQGHYSSGFGYRIHPVYGYGRFHSGVDITAGYGAPIHATAAGRVVTSGWLGGYGNAIEIDHGNGLKTLYGHCSTLAVGRGAFVKKGQVIAYVGSTGVSTGPHVHYEVSRGGTQINPDPYLRQKDLASILSNI